MTDINAAARPVAFRELSPDGKIPALVTRTEPAVSLFESGAILLYLADLYPQLHGQSELERAYTVSWTFWQVGQLGPLIGQYGRVNGSDTPNEVRSVTLKGLSGVALMYWKIS